ncbi:MAG: hypothetical protein GY759_10055 [Chloroflexi bacterium]|nr:hypothetical protein [Chloroflexota bacterium]
MLRAIFKMHFMAVLAIIGSLFGSLLLFLIGAFEVFEAFLLFFGFGHPGSLGFRVVLIFSTLYLGAGTTSH